jgi:hypothetical protein
MYKPYLYLHPTSEKQALIYLIRFFFPAFSASAGSGGGGGGCGLRLQSKFGGQSPCFNFFSCLHPQLLLLLVAAQIVIFDTEER